MDVRSNFYGIWIVNVIFLFGGFWKEAQAQRLCGMLNTEGYTVPLGDITLEYGNALDITCNLYKDAVGQYGENASSRLYFTRNNIPIAREMIEILNSTSIRLYVEKPPKVTSDNYYCLFRKQNDLSNSNTIVCMNVVMVGVPPQNVTDFSCISRNYDNLTCTWTPPENYIRTDYNLSYTLRGRAARKNPFPCPKLNILDDGKMSCFWNVSTRPQYRQVHPTFLFTLRMNNTFGVQKEYFTFDHFKHVLPNPPENLTAVATSSDSIHLSWVVPSSMLGFPPGLNHRILYQCEYYEQKFKFGGNITDSPRNKTLQFDLTGLKYAHALCDIRVSMRSVEADEDDESMWSEPATRTVRTLSKVPDCPPETNQGSFELVERGLHRDAYVYWKQIMEDQQNGQDFVYKVEVENHPTMKPVEFTKAYAKFQDLKLANYTIHVWSYNEKGYSQNKSTVFIPAKRVNEPLNFIKLARSKDSFELSWDPPKSSDIEITNYTIFWCDNERDRPYQCTGNLNWKVVSNDITQYNQTLTKYNIYQFAISANSEHSSSGMLWAECTIIPDKNLGKMKNVWINRVGSDFIEVEWKIDCSDRISNVKGFIIYYCPVVSSVQTQCIEHPENKTIPGDKSIQTGRVDNLKPHTTYQLTVSVITDHLTYSQSSEPMYNVTNEAAPATPPLNIRLFNITNSSVSLRWDPPAIINGKLKYYLVNTNYEKRKVDPNINMLTLGELDSFENYSISLQACTVACSAPSEVKTVVTQMWQPEKIGRPSVIFSNNSVITIGWDKPNPPRGEINYYQLRFSDSRSTDNQSFEIINVTNVKNYSTSCESKRSTFFVSVRAVNIIKGEHKWGNWSDELESTCTQFSSIIYIVFALLVIFVAVGLFYGGRRLYNYCEAMRDVEVKLPQGLAPVVEQRDLVPWSSEKNTEDIDRHSRADEEYLLTKIPDNRLSGDSSGCSSGHESITSSLESGTHISTSDSGTDQPRSLDDENRRNSLRQRNVSSKGYVTADTLAGTMNWAPKPVPTPSGNYCVLGVDPSSQTETESPYVPVTDICTNISLPYISHDTQPSPPYVVTGDFIKTPNPGYIPYNASEPPEKKNTGYVVAGLTENFFVPDLLQCDGLKKEDNSPEHLASLKRVQLSWQPSIESTLPKTGYVSVGDASPPPKTISDVSKGYVSHRQFETKALKED